MSRYDYYGLSEQAKAGTKRLRDAKILFQGEAWRGSMYLAGYAVECGLKAKLMEMNGLKTLKELEEKYGDDVVCHSLEKLMSKTNRFLQLQKDDECRKAFNLCKMWKTTWRYDPHDGSQDEAEDFLASVEKIGQFIRHSI